MNNHPVLALLEMELPEVMDHIKWELHAAGYTIISDGDNYIFGIPPSSAPWSKVCLVAHFDTLVPKNRATGLHLRAVDLDVTNGIVRNRNGVLGADDRAGVCANLEAMKASEQKPFMIFTNYEETQGAHVCAGVKRFIADNVLTTWLNDIYLFIEPDRKGVDEYVYYSWNIPKSVSQLMFDYGYQEENGSYSDVADLSDAYSIPHVNISVGYHRQHTPHELLNLSGLDWTTQNIVKILNDTSVVQEKLQVYTPTKKTTSWVTTDCEYRIKYLKNMGCTMKEIQDFGVDALWDQIFDDDEDAEAKRYTTGSNEIEVEDDDEVCGCCGFGSGYLFNSVCPQCEDEILSSKFIRWDEDGKVVVTVDEYHRILNLEYELEKNTKRELPATRVEFPEVLEPPTVVKALGPGSKGIQFMPGIRVLPSGNFVTQ